MRLSAVAIVGLAASCWAFSQTYTINTFAGNGTEGYGGDNGPAAGAELNNPCGVAVDAAGNLYIADPGNNRVRKVTNGVITTAAGNGTLGYSGDNGPATDAQLASPLGVAVDSAGNLYIADTSNQRVRKVSNGVITTVAGNGTPGFSGDNGPAASAQLNHPFDVAVDAAGNLYIADTSNQRIREVSNGSITTAAGSGWQCDGGGLGGEPPINCFSGDGGPATSAWMYNPSGVAVDAVGNLYIADTLNNVVRKVSNGVITTVAGIAYPGFSGDNGSATGAALDHPYGVALGASGNLYVADASNSRIREVWNGVITTVAGGEAPGFGGDNGPATSAELNGPVGLAADSAGRLYIADELNQRIRVLAPLAAPGIPQFNAGGVVNGASYTAPVVPGSIAAVLGAFFVNYASDTDLPLDTSLQNLSFQFGGGAEARLFFVSAEQVDLQVPWELAGQSAATLAATLNDQAGPTQTVNLASFAPAIFAANSTGIGQGAILDPSYRLVDSSNPAAAGTTIVLIFCTGLGAVTNQPATGSPGPSSPLAWTTTLPTVTIGGVPATVFFAGLAPAFVGLYQVNALVPAGVAANSAAPVLISMGGVNSNTVTIAVH